MNEFRYWLVIFVAWLPVEVPAAGAVEPWADSNLQVWEGLACWFDASRVSRDASLPADSRVRVWSDASGQQRDLQQQDDRSRPLAMRFGPAAVVRFDGVDDCLRGVGQQLELRSFTVVLVAAPHDNIGSSRTLLSLGPAGDVATSSGISINLGTNATGDFSVLNVEGRGVGEHRNLRTQSTPFGRLQRLIVAADANEVRLMVNGEVEGALPWDGAPLDVNAVTIAGRFDWSAPNDQHIGGLCHADVAELLIYDRLLRADELDSVNRYLSSKYASVGDRLAAHSADRREPLVTVDDPPPVQFLVPGFTVRRLPVELTNINNVQYRPDGTLVALGYDGRVWLLRDTDDDGLEDDAQEFWSNPAGLRATIGMDLTPPGYEHGDGVFIASKTACLLVIDTDGDEGADKEIEVAGGWKESFHAVDALGITYDPQDGSIYYGRGTYNFTDPLLRDEQGVAHYSLTDESSAIIRVSPDFKKRSIVATGIRFPVAMRMNRQGDLFATDQEGATWVPNGNPFDELLHIQQGRHYGFPARHPTHVPDVIDEPSTFDYGPQHQSTCGLNFNEPVSEGGPIFGPQTWRGDALVSGYSRGKLYRTELVKSKVGYVARNQILACLSQLTVDACVGPRGELVVACHSGGPDWGSGPTGTGTLYKVSYTDRDHPQPALIWPAGPHELRVELDRPVDPQLLKDVLTGAKLTSGQFVRAGDRFESLWPGYANVQKQKLSPRFNVPIRSAQLTPDGRTLVLMTDPIASAVHYALTLPGMGRAKHDRLQVGALPQLAEIDVGFDLSGCEATWTPADGSASWTGWLPHFDLQVTREFTVGSAAHDALWEAMEKPGELTLRTQLNLTDMLRPEVQPGSQLDHEYPPEVVHVTFETAERNTIELVEPAEFASGAHEGSSTSFTLPADAPRSVDVMLRLSTTSSPAVLNVSWTTEEDATPRPFALHRQRVPWAVTDPTEFTKEVVTAVPELDGGDWHRGREVYFADDAACSKCHAIYGRGSQIGPDLSNLVHRDYTSVLRDITQPNFAINPDHLSNVVVLKDGRVLSGVVRTVGRQLSVGDAKGVVTLVDRDEVEDITASPVSTMPEGLPKLIGPERMRDLMMFLLTPAPEDFAWPVEESTN